MQTKKEICLSRAVRRSAVVCVSCLLSCLLLLMATGCSDTGSAAIITYSQASSEIGAEESYDQPDFQGQDARGEDEAGETTKESAMPSLVYVHVCGQVISPGVYSLTEGSRVWDAVEAAGGFLSEAATQAINLAMVVADGSKVTIPHESEAEDDDFRWYEMEGKSLTIGGMVVGGGYDLTWDRTGDNSQNVVRQVNINRADINTLMTIPGIGQSKAEAIVSYRETVGYFGTIEEIMQVEGIKEGLFAKIKEYITVGG